MLKTPKDVCSLQHLTYLSTGIPSSSPTRTPDPNEETGGNHHAKPKFMKHLTTIYPYEPSITHHPHLMQPWIILNPSNHPFFEHVISPSNHIKKLLISIHPTTVWIHLTNRHPLLTGHVWWELFWGGKFNAPRSFRFRCLHVLWGPDRWCWQMFEANRR